MRLGTCAVRRRRYVRRGHPVAGGAAAFLFSVGLLAAPALSAQGTQAGTRFTNWATLSFTSVGTGYTVASDTVSLLVAQVAGVSLQPPHVNSGLPGTTVVFAHTLTNTGNGPDSFAVAAVSARGWPVTLYQDWNGDGVLDAGDSLLTGLIPLAYGAGAPLLAQVAIPAGAGPGVSDTIMVTATSRFNPAVSRSVQDRLDVSAAGAVTIGLTKQVDRLTGFAGDVLTYTLTYAASGSGTDSSVVLADTVPTGASYVAGSMRWNGTSLTDAGGDDAGSFVARGGGGGGGRGGGGGGGAGGGGGGQGGRVRRRRARRGGRQRRSRGGGNGGNGDVPGEDRFRSGAHCDQPWRRDLRGVGSLLHCVLERRPDERTRAGADPGQGARWSPSGTDRAAGAIHPTLRRRGQRRARVQRRPDRYAPGGPQLSERHTGADQRGTGAELGAREPRAGGYWGRHSRSAGEQHRAGYGICPQRRRPGRDQRHSPGRECPTRGAHRTAHRGDRTRPHGRCARRRDRRRDSVHRSGAESRQRADLRHPNRQHAARGGGLRPWDRHRSRFGAGGRGAPDPRDHGASRPRCDADAALRRGADLRVGDDGRGPGDRQRALRSAAARLTAGRGVGASAACLADGDQGGDRQGVDRPRRLGRARAERWRPRGHRHLDGGRPGRDDRLHRQVLVRELAPRAAHAAARSPHPARRLSDRGRGHPVGRGERVDDAPGGLPRRPGRDAARRGGATRSRGGSVHVRASAGRRGRTGRRAPARGNGL